VVEIYPTRRPSFGFGVVFCSFARRARHAVTQHGVLRLLVVPVWFLPALISAGFWHLSSWRNTFCGGAQLSLVHCQ